MAGPWEKYQAAPAQQDGPWSKYASAPQEQAPAAPEGEVGWLTPVDDSMRVAADSISRGYLDKLSGEEAQQHTARSRERLPGWVETPIDIAAAVASSPYRIGSAGAGALAGAAEGAASAYGHQEGWVPGWDVLKGAAVGAATGGLGAKAGEWLGGGKAIRDAEAVAPPPNATQAANVDRIVAAKGSTREEFGKLMADLENAPPEVQAKVAEIVGGKSLTSRAGEMIPKTLTEGGIERTMLAALTLGPKAAAVRVGAQGLKKAGESDWANKVPARSLDDLAAMAAKGELEIDPATIDRWRDAFAKAGIGYGRSP